MKKYRFKNRFLAILLLIFYPKSFMDKIDQYTKIIENFARSDVRNRMSEKHKNEMLRAFDTKDIKLNLTGDRHPFFRIAIPPVLDMRDQYFHHVAESEIKTFEGHRISVDFGLTDDIPQELLDDKISIALAKRLILLKAIQCEKIGRTAVYYIDYIK